SGNHRIVRSDGTLNPFGHIELQLRLRVGEEEDIGLALLLVQFRFERGEDIQLRLARLRDVEIEAVLTAPEETLLAWNALQSVEIDVPPFEDRRIFIGEIVADDRHEIHLGEERRRDGEISRRAAEAAVHFPEWCLNRVERDRADDRDAHGIYRPMIGLSSRLICDGISFGSVT